MTPSITKKQARFVREYLVDLNGTQAAIRAGYSARSANEQAAKMLAKGSVSVAVQEAQKKLAEKHDLTLDSIVTELRPVAFSNMADYVRITADGEPAIDLSAVTRAQMAAVSELTVEDFTEGRGEDKRDVRRVKLKLWNKPQALVDLGKHLGGFASRGEKAAEAAVTLLALIEQSMKRNGEGAKVIEADPVPTLAKMVAVAAGEATGEDERKSNGE